MVEHNLLESKKQPVGSSKKMMPKVKICFCCKSDYPPPGGWVKCRSIIA